MSKKQAGDVIKDQIALLEERIQRVQQELESLREVIDLINAFEKLGADQTSTPPITLRDMVNRFEVSLLRRALERTAGHQVRAAKLLGLQVTSLASMIKRHGINPLDYSTAADLEKKPSSKKKV